MNKPAKIKLWNGRISPIKKIKSTWYHGFIFNDKSAFIYDWYEDTFSTVLKRRKRKKKAVRVELDSMNMSEINRLYNFILLNSDMIKPINFNDYEVKAGFIQYDDENKDILLYRYKCDWDDSPIKKLPNVWKPKIRNRLAPSNITPYDVNRSTFQFCKEEYVFSEDYYFSYPLLLRFYNKYVSPIFDSYFEEPIYFDCREYYEHPTIPALCFSSFVNAVHDIFKDDINVRSLLESYSNDLNGKIYGYTTFKLYTTKAEINDYCMVPRLGFCIDLDYHTVTFYPYVHDKHPEEMVSSSDHIFYHLDPYTHFGVFSQPFQLPICAKPNESNEEIILGIW